MVDAPGEVYDERAPGEVDDERAPGEVDDERAPGEVDDERAPGEVDDEGAPAVEVEEVEEGAPMEGGEPIDEEGSGGDAELSRNTVDVRRLLDQEED